MSDYVSNDVETAAYLARENDPVLDDRPSAEEAELDIMPRDADGRLIFAVAVALDGKQERPDA